MIENQMSGDQGHSGSSNVTSSDEIKKCFRLLEEGEKKVKINQKEIVLVLGITGSGKTTVVQFLAGDNSKLFAKEVEGNYGEFTIEDSEHKISGDSTIVSKTIFPELKVDSKTNTAYYDCPGSEDTRGTAVDVAATYLVRKVIKNAKKIKFLLTVSHSSVRAGIDRNGFVNLVKHVVTLVKNIRKFENSIMLVVTKVENSYQKVGKEKVLISDESVINNIAKFLMTCKQNVAKVAKGELAERAEKLIDILLIKNEEGYQRIGLFRRPEEAGPLSEMKTLQDEKIRIQKIVEENLMYANTAENDFGYSISEKSKNDVNDMIEQINNDIANCVKEIAVEIIEYYNMEEFKSIELENVHREFNILHEKTRDIVQNIEMNLNLNDFIGKLIRLMYDLNIRSTNNCITGLTQQNKYLEFMEVVSQKKIRDSSLFWKNELSQVAEHFNTRKNWYSFLINLYEKLSSYDIQKKKSELTYLFEEEMTDINNQRFKQFIESYMPEHSEYIENVKSDSVKSRALNVIIKSTLANTNFQNIDISSNRYEIRGDYIKLSDLQIVHLRSAKFINIFATKKVFFDVDLEDIVSTDPPEFTVIAPTWEVIGQRKIVLNGLDGCCVPGSPAHDGYYAGAKGQDGVPGVPGEPAGNFFGIGNRFINGHNLIILANGGRGSAGQHGGNGAAGYDGRSPSSGEEMKNFGHRYLEGSFLWIYRYYCIFGEEGGNGGNGGNGGFGGEGGQAGDIKIITLSENPHIKMLNGKGEKGDNGFGGPGGRGGFHGTSIESEKFLWWWNGNFISSDCTKYDDRHGIPGQDGKIGKNNEGWKLPRIVTRLNNAWIVNNYKEFLLESLIHEKVNFEEQNEFLKKLNANLSVIDLYDIAGFMKEFVLLENQCMTENCSFLLPVLKQFSQVIENAAEKIKGTEQKLSLSTLYTAILSRILLMKEKPRSKLVTNVSKYLQSVADDIQKISLMNDDYFINYRTEIKEMIEDTNSFIEKYMKIEFDRLSKLLQENVDLLVQEITSSPNTEHEAVDDLYQKLKLFLVSLIMMRVPSEILQLLKSAVTKASQAINKPISVSKSFLVGNDAEINMPDEIIQFSDVAIEFRKNFIIDSKILIRSIIEDLKNKSLTISSDKLTAMEKYENQLDTINDEEILTIRNKVKSRLEFMIKDLQKENHDEKSMKTVEVLLKTRNFMKICDTGIRNCAGVAKNNEKLNTLLDAINPVDLYFTRLQFYGEKIEDLVSSIRSNDYSSLQMRIGDVKVLMRQMKEEFILPEEFTSLFNKLEKAVNDIKNLYDHLDFYESYSKLIINFKNVEVHAAGNERSKNEIDSLKTIIKSNTLMVMYKDMVKTISDFIFPFAPYYSETFDLNLSTERDPVNKILSRVDTIKSGIMKFGTSIDEKFDKSVIRAEFAGHDNSSNSLYRWDSLYFAKAASDLLAGKEIILKADATKGVPKQAIKFNKIKTKLGCSDEKLQKQLNTDLQDFNVMLTHLGNSVFRCGNDFYTITFEKQAMEYSFKQTKAGEPMYSNAVYDKIRDGDFILSPYTFWSLQLKGLNFDKLKVYENCVDVELEGHGQFLEDNSFCNNTLKNKYVVDSSTFKSMTSDENRFDLRDVRLEVMNRKNSSSAASMNLSNSHQRKRRSVKYPNQINSTFDDLPYEKQGNEGEPEYKGIFNWFSKIIPRIYPSYNDNNISPTSIDKGSASMPVSSPDINYSVHDTLILTDLLIRVVTKSKPKYFKTCAVNYQHVRFCVLEIITEFEKILSTVCASQLCEHLEFDPVPLMASLEHEIINGNGSNIGSILLDTIRKYSLMDDDELYRRLNTVAY